MRPHRGQAPTQRKNESMWPVLRRLLAELRPEYARIVAAMVLTAVAVVLMVAGPKLLGDGTNIIFKGVAARMIPPGMSSAQYVAQLREEGHTKLASMLDSTDVVAQSGIDFEALRNVLILVLLAYGLAALCYFLSALLIRTIVHYTGYRLRQKVQVKIDRLPLSFIDSRRRGDLMSRVTNDVDNVTRALQQTLMQLFDGILTIIGILAMMFWISWKLAILAIVVVPLGGVVATVIAKRGQPYFRKKWKATGDLGGIVEEAFTGHEVIQAFTLREEFIGQFTKANESLCKSATRAEAISMLMEPAMKLVSNLSYVIVAVAGGLQVASGSISLGSVQAFIQYSRQFTQPISTLASMAAVLQSAVASAERIFEFLDTTEMEPDAKPDPENSVLQNAQITFDHVQFGYDSKDPVIRDLSLRVEPGQMVAIVGPTGAGKTTLVNLIMRFYELDAGTIAINGRDIAQMNKDDLRRRIGMVLQDTWLFEGTIEENIAYGSDKAVSRDEVIAAAKDAQADAFIRHLPHGYDTKIKDEGSNLSQGERQLLTIARAFISQPEVLILDEATSSVDTRTEIVIQEAMERLRKGRTSFVIAHRLSTIRSADVILVLEDGDVVEQGSHDELLAKDGAYAKLHSLQFGQGKNCTLRAGQELHTSGRARTANFGQG